MERYSSSDGPDSQPTPQEREQGIGNKWTRKGLWWFRFEIKSLVPDRNTNKIVTLATKDAADHAFAVKTANWGWQQFAKRDGLFLNSAVQAADGLVITCTIQAQPQPPAGYWLGMGLPATSPIAAVTTVGAKTVGSGGGLSAWAGGAGAGGGVAGGAAAGGGVKRVVPNDLVSAVGSMLGDPSESWSAPNNRRLPKFTLMSSSSSLRAQGLAKGDRRGSESTQLRNCSYDTNTSRRCSRAGSAKVTA